jgi:hypothetical protein
MSKTTDLFSVRLSLNKCYFSFENLSNDDFLISKVKFPELYNKNFDQNEYILIKSLLSFFHKENQFILDLDHEKKEKIKLFFNLLFLVPNMQYIKEREIHLYLYLFWEDIIWLGKKNNPFERKYFYYEGKKKEHLLNDNFQDYLLPKISKNCDLIYFDKNNNTIELIDIKQISLDDRAISQIQRYYRQTIEICDNTDHMLKINRLIPTLIVNANEKIINPNSKDRKDKITLLEYWLTFPLYFRELLNIYAYEYSTHTKTIKLKNLKPTIKTLLKEKYKKK